MGRGCWFDPSHWRHTGDSCNGSTPVQKTGKRETVCGFESLISRQIRNSKHNRYCGGLLIRSPMDFGVQVQVLPVPPKEKGEAVTVRIAKDGFLICPKCGRKTKNKVIPGTTQLIRFPLYCFRCREEFEIDYK